MTLRHRKETDGDDSQEGWTLKLPGVAGGVALAREEFSWPGARDALPPEAVGLVRAMTRGAPLEPVATVETERRRVRLIDGAGRAVAEVDDDWVVAMGADGRSSRFREIEVEAAEGAPSGLLGAVGARLREAGATEGSRHPKVFRVLGPKAEEPPDPVVPALDRRARLREVISASIAAGVAALVEQDPGIRLGGDSEHVHKARVATRRLRSDLRTFRPVLDRGWVGRMREEPRWVGAALGAVRDADVLLEELRSQGASLPKLDAPAAEALLARLSSERKAANERLLTILDSDRYLALLSDLTAAANDPPLGGPAAEPEATGRLILPRLLARPARRLRRGVRGLGDDPSDESLHEVQKCAKDLRYAAEAAVPVLGTPARKLAAAAQELQEVLGGLHDAVVAEACFDAVAPAARRRRHWSPGS
ncbi:MAG: hypothetical protein QOD62_1727 [Actinomycetota bacterium]|nr:hypothetical protein [Actinomycetota bacterium]